MANNQEILFYGRFLEDEETNEINNANDLLTLDDIIVFIDDFDFLELLGYNLDQLLNNDIQILNKLIKDKFNNEDKKKYFKDLVERGETKIINKFIPRFRRDRKIMIEAVRQKDIDTRLTRAVMSVPRPRPVLDARVRCSVNQLYQATGQHINVIDTVDNFLSINPSTFDTDFFKDICCCSDGRILVCNSGRRKIQQLVIQDGMTQLVDIVGDIDCPLVGVLEQPGHVDGNQDEARFVFPTAICEAIDGSIIVADFLGPETLNYDCSLLRRIVFTETGCQVSTICGKIPDYNYPDLPYDYFYIDDSMGRKHPLGLITSMTPTLDGAILLCDLGDMVYRVQITKEPLGFCRSIVGNYKQGLLDGRGDRASINFNSRKNGITCCPDGSYILCDEGNKCIRRIYPSEMTLKSSVPLPSEHKRGVFSIKTIINQYNLEMDEIFYDCVCDMNGRLIFLTNRNIYIKDLARNKEENKVSLNLEIDLGLRLPEDSLGYTLSLDVIGNLIISNGHHISIIQTERVAELLPPCHFRQQFSILLQSQLRGRQLAINNSHLSSQLARMGGKSVPRTISLLPTRVRDFMRTILLIGQRMINIGEPQTGNRQLVALNLPVLPQELWIYIMQCLIIKDIDRADMGNIYELNNPRNVYKLRDKEIDSMLRELKERFPKLDEYRLKYFKKYLKQYKTTQDTIVDESGTVFDLTSKNELYNYLFEEVSIAILESSDHQNYFNNNS